LLIKIVCISTSKLLKKEIQKVMLIKRLSIGNILEYVHFKQISFPHAFPSQANRYVYFTPLKTINNSE